MCNYQGYEFGGGYLDSVCIDGYLWDADSGDEYALDHGGDTPCPKCNSRTWMDHHREQIIGVGFDMGYDGVRPKVVMRGGYPEVIRADTKLMALAKRWIKRGWYQGMRYASRETRAKA